VASYFSTVDPSTLPDPKQATYPKGGRATPDVAALGTGYTLIIRGQKMPGVGGTSASAPVFAAMVSLINDALNTAGKPAVGFMNPLIYQNADAFFDVTVGSNKVGRGGGVLTQGFNCSKGWDPVTGMGTPHYPKLLAAAMAAMAAH
jgi:tripeptidyl-peptidase-1